MPPEKVKCDYGEITWVEYAQLIGVLLRLPFVLLYHIVRALFLEHNASKSWEHITIESLFRYLILNLNTQQCQYSSKSTLEVYNDWMKKHGATPVIESLEEDTRLLWFGPKNTGKVILYCHGGAFLIPMQDTALYFLEHIRNKLNDKHIPVGIAILNYAVVPNGVFPTQLRQISLAVSHLVDSGVKPGDIQLMGDCAGGNLILQLVSHILHPLDGVPPLRVYDPFGGVVLLSPWASVASDLDAVKSHPANTTDIVNFQQLHEWSEVVLDDVPKPDMPYADPAQAPNHWYKGVARVVKRFVITAGDAECMKDGIVAIAQKLKKCHASGKVDLIVKRGGVHAVPMDDFFFARWKEPKVSDAMSVIISGLALGFSE